MAKKNTSIRVDLNKIYLYVKDKKIHLLIILALVLSVRAKCGWIKGEPTIMIECNPLTVEQLHYLIGD